MKRERRVVSGALEARAAADPGQPKTIVGYAAIFDSPTTIADYFVEQIAPGAFDKAIGRDDVRALFNHDENLVLGRTTSGTLKLSVDSRGLRYEITPPDTSTARDLAELIGRGDVTQSSFCFRASAEEWNWDAEPPVRTLLDLELYDVSPVTFPAYDDTDVAMRSDAERSLAEARAAREAASPPATGPARGALLKRRIEIDLRSRGGR